MVTGEDDDIFRIVFVDEMDVLIDGICGAFVPVGSLDLLVRGQNVDAAAGAVEIPGFSVPDVVVQLKRLILGQNADGVDAGIDTVGQRKVDDAIFPSERNGRFGDLVGEDPQPAALSARKKHGNAFSFACHK